METTINGVNAVLLIIAVVAVIVAACALLFPWLKKKGADVPAALKAAGGVLKGADTVTDVLKAAFPTSLIANIADKVIDYAQIGVQKAEQLYIINQISGDGRKAEASKFVYDALTLAGIERNAAIDKIVDGAIEAAVLALGHEPKPPDIPATAANWENYSGAAGA
jgi:hypothetical protein